VRRARTTDSNKRLHKEKLALKLHNDRTLGARAFSGIISVVMRIGAVNYLNSKPLVYGLDVLAPPTRLSFDLPSRLADSLLVGRLDVALIPSVEFFRTPGSAIVSDACVACRGPVLSVKLHFRVPPADVRRVALDEGSRTSAALTRILLAEMYDIQPKWEPLPIGCGIDTTDADAVLLIGDRAISDNRFRNADSRAGSSTPSTAPQLRRGLGPRLAVDRMDRSAFCVCNVDRATRLRCGRADKNTQCGARQWPAASNGNCRSRSAFGWNFK
jgi:hypothetical protein